MTTTSPATRPGASSCAAVSPTARSADVRSHTPNNIVARGQVVASGFVDVRHPRQRRQRNGADVTERTTREGRTMATDDESVRDVLARMADDGQWIIDQVEALGDLTKMPPTTLIEAVGMASLVVRASGMVVVACGDAIARQMASVADGAEPTD